MSTTKRIIMAAFAVSTLVLLSACGTVHGFGQDVSKAGRDIQQASR